MNDTKWNTMFIITLAIVILFQQLEIKELQTFIQKNHSTIATLQQEQRVLKESRSTQMTLTAYSPEVRQTDSTPYETAFMTKVDDWTIALSWDVLQKGVFTPGKKVYIRGEGVFTINDKMSDVWSKRADVFYFNTHHALEFGVKHNVSMVLIEG